MSEEKLAGKFTSEEELVKGLTNLMGVESLEDVYKTLESQRNKPKPEPEPTPEVPQDNSEVLTKLAQLEAQMKQREAMDKVGGMENFNKVVNWAKENLGDQQELILKQLSNPETAQFTFNALEAQMKLSNPSLIGGTAGVNPTANHPHFSSDEEATATLAEAIKSGASQREIRAIRQKMQEYFHSKHGVK